MKIELITTAFIFYNDKLLLIKHKKSNKWLHVGGHVEADEVLDDALIREIKEEVNLDVEIPQETVLGDTDYSKELAVPFYLHIHDTKENHRHLYFDYIAITKNVKDLKIKNEEILDYKWFTKKELQTNKKIWEPIKKLGFRAFDGYERRIKSRL